MCGIAGYTTLQQTSKKIDPDHIGPMLKSLNHRGPDESGYVAYPNLVFGNTRLSIVGIGNGKQPIFNEDNTIAIVCNGEIYNSPELKIQLEKKGHKFKTLSDVETIVHLYEEEATKAFSLLNGMFAFALYDVKKQLLYLVRDRFGIKPLFYFNNQGLLAFASEIKALKLLPQFNSALSPNGLATYLSLSYIADPWTIYKDVSRLKPGHYMEITHNKISIKKYFELPYQEKIQINSNAAKEELLYLLKQSIRRQHMSEVPIAILLSSGMDSRSILAMSKDFNKDLSTFTLSFAEKDYDENQEAQYWAKHFNAKHHSVVYTAQQLAAQLLKRQQHLDEPYGIWANVAFAHLARQIHAEKYKVILSGSGGDELFLGYPTIHAAVVAKYYNRFFPNFLHKNFTLPISQALPAGRGRLPFTFKLKSFANAINKDIHKTFFAFKEIIPYKNWSTILTEEAFSIIGSIDPFIAFEQYREEVANLTLVDQLSYFDMKVFLPSCILHGADNAYMSASIEDRVPFLDNDLVDFSCKLPTAIKFNLLQPKVLLKQALSELIPLPKQEKVNKMTCLKKKGFALPCQPWLKESSINTLLNTVLSETRLKKSNFFKVEEVQKILKVQLNGRENLERVIQTISSLELFLDGSYQI